MGSTRVSHSVARDRPSGSVPYDQGSLPRCQRMDRHVADTWQYKCPTALERHGA